MRSFGVICVFATAAVAAPVFTNLDPSTPPPGRRSSGGAIVSGGGDTFVAYGGFTGAAMPLSDVPAYSTATNAWTTATTALPGRERHGFAYDPLSGRFVIFGGLNGFTLSNAVYLLNGPARTPSSPPTPGSPPSARADPVLQWIPPWQRFLVFGGRTSAFANNFVGDTWSLSVADAGVTWSPIAGAGPSARGATCTAWDPVRAQLVLFGGEAMNDLADTWTFAPDGGGWRSQTVSGTAPSARSFAACAWDPNLNELVLYGGQAGNNATAGLFSFNPATNVWTSHTVTGMSPGALSDSVMVYSPALQGLVLFGGRDGAGTYLNTLWLLRFNGAPVVDAGAPFSVGEGVSASLSGSAVDPDGDPMTYRWTQVQGPTVSLLSETTLSTSFTTPTVVAATPLRFRLTADDSRTTGFAEVVVTVDNTVNEPPVVDAGPDQMVIPGDVVFLLASATDPNGDAIAGYTWTQTAGPASGFVQNGASITFPAPVRTMPSTLTFQVVARDATASSLPDTVTVSVPAGAMPLDAGEPADAGVEPADAGTADAGVADAGMAVDAGLVDAGADVDAGMDAGAAPDAGTDAGADAGTDAGAEPDAGLPVDGGLDAGAGGDAGGGAPAMRAYAVGCGCTEAPLSAGWLWFALLAVVSGRRRTERVRCPEPPV